MFTLGRISFILPRRLHSLLLKGAQSWLNGFKSLAKLFKFVVCNPCQSSPSILVPLWFIIISLVFFYLSKVLFSGFLQFNGNFVDGHKNSGKIPRLSPFNDRRILIGVGVVA